MVLIHVNPLVLRRFRLPGETSLTVWPHKCPTHFYALVFGSKTETRRKESATNKVTEFTADGNINLLAKDDVTLEAARVNTQKNANITSRTGQVNFKAVKNTTFEQTITESTGFFITHSDKGYIENTWVLPAIHLGGKLTVEAANGINADIKAKNGQSLQAAVSVFGNTPPPG